MYIHAKCATVRQQRPLRLAFYSITETKAFRELRILLWNRPEKRSEAFSIRRAETEKVPIRVFGNKSNAAPKVDELHFRLVAFSNGLYEHGRTGGELGKSREK